MRNAWLIILGAASWTFGAEPAETKNSQDQPRKERPLPAEHQRHPQTAGQPHLGGPVPLGRQPHLGGPTPLGRQPRFIADDLSLPPTAPLQKLTGNRFQLRWGVLSATKFAEQTPQFPTNLKVADGKPIRVTGFMTPLDSAPETDVFLLMGSTIDCFFCQTPDPTGVLLVQLTGGKRHRVVFEPITVTGTLTLNDSDPEDFLYLLDEAKVVPLPTPAEPREPKQKAKQK